MRKFLTVMALVLFLGGTTLQLAICRAQANNHADSSFLFQFTREDTMTTARRKTDASSCYMKCTSMPRNMSYTAYVYGTNYADKQILVDESKGKHYIFNKGTVHFMRNWVYEDHFRYALIGANRNQGFQFLANGVWSPDSVPE